MEVEILRRVARRRDHDGREGVGGGGDVEGIRVGRTRLRAVGWGKEPDLANLRVNDGAWSSTSSIHGLVVNKQSEVGVVRVQISMLGGYRKWEHV